MAIRKKVAIFHIITKTKIFKIKPFLSPQDALNLICGQLYHHNKIKGLEGLKINHFRQ